MLSEPCYTPTHTQQVYDFKDTFAKKLLMSYFALESFNTFTMVYNK